MVYIVLRLHRAGDSADAAWKEEGRMILLQLFWGFLQIGLFSFGGGYAAMPLIRAQIVTQHGWLGMAEFTDRLVTIADDAGADLINAATFVGCAWRARVRWLRRWGASRVRAGDAAGTAVSAYRNFLLQGVLTSLRPAVAMIASAGVSHSRHRVL